MYLTVLGEAGRKIFKFLLRARSPRVLVLFFIQNRSRFLLNKEKISTFEPNNSNDSTDFGSQLVRVQEITQLLWKAGKRNIILTEHVF